MRFFLSLLLLGVAAVTPASAAVTNDIVVGISGGNFFTLQVVRLNGSNGAPVWTHTSSLHNSPVSAVGMDPVDQSVYFAIGRFGQKLTSNGTLVWGGLVNGFPAVNWGLIPTPASFAFNPFDQRAYVSAVCSHGWLAQINGTNGSVVWGVGGAQSTDLDDVPSLSLGNNDGSLYGVAGNNGRLYKYSGTGSRIFAKNVSWSVAGADCNGGRGDFSRRNGSFYAAGGNTSGIFPTNLLRRFDQNGNVIATLSLPLNARVTGIAVDNASASSSYGSVYVSAGRNIYKFTENLSLQWGPVDIGNTADFLVVEPLNGGLFVGSIGGKFVQQRFTFNGSAGWTFFTGTQPPSAMSSQRLVEPYLTFTSAPQSVAAGACSAAATVRTMTAQNGIAATGANVALSANSGTMLFYTTSGCLGSPVASISIPPGSNSASFFFKDTTAGSPVITASATVSGYALATQAQTIAVPAVPAAVNNLAAATQSTFSVTLNWTSPGNSGNSGTLVGSYDIGYALTPIAEPPSPPASVSFTDPSVTHVSIATTTAPGLSQTRVIAGLSSSTTYYFALKTTNSSGNTSPLSNLASARTFSLSTSTDGAVSLVSPVPGMSLTIVSAPTAQSVALQQGLSQVTAIYDLLPDGVSFNPPARLTFAYPIGTSTATLAIYRFDGLMWSSAAVTNQSINVPGGTITGFTTGSSLYAVFARDIRPPRTTLNIGQPRFGAPPPFITSATTMSLSAVDDLQAAGDGKGSGVAQTRYAIDSGAFATFSAPFSVAGDGLHSIRFFSTDLAGNVEAAQTSTVRVDNVAPATSLATVGGKQAPGPDAASIFASSDTRISLSAADPVVGGVASGVALTRYQDNGGVFQTYSSSFTLDQGSHTLAYQSRDNVGNTEALQSRTFLVDATAPVSTASVGAPLYVSPAGVKFISPATPVTLSAVDPVVANVASGVERIEVSINGGAFVAYASALTFAEGRHVVLFRAVDRVGNGETARTLELQVDATAPLTARSLSGGFEFTDAGGNLFVSSGTRLAFTAVDPVPALPGALASGVAFTQFRLDAPPTAPFITFVSPLAPLAEGLHVVEFRSQDNIGNVETTRTLAITYDASKPLITITAPSAGSYVATKNTIPVSFTVTDNFDPAPAVSAVLTQLQDRGSPRGARPTIVAVTSGQVIQPLSLDDGLWQLRVSATDFVKNAAVATGDAFEVVHDTLAPRSTLAIGAPQASGGPGGSVFVTRATMFTLSSLDDLVSVNDAAGLGVSFQELKVDTALRARFSNPSPASGQTFISTFTLSADADGLRALSFYAEDVLANREAARLASVAVDNTAPVTALAAIDGQQFPGPAGSFYASVATRISLAAADPVVNGVASGLALTEYQDNGGAFQTFTAPFNLAEGRHVLAYHSRDRVQNLEVMRSSTVLVDATAPTTTAGVGAPQFVAADGARYVTPASTVTFSAADPALPGGHAGSGVDRVELSLDGAAFAAVSSALTLPEGRHTLLYRAVDNVGNTEAARSLELRSDATPPVTTAQIGAPLFTAADGTHYITPATPVSFSAVDPLMGEVVSGVQRVEVAVDGGPFAARSTPLTFAEGRHTVLYRAVDNVGNVEAAKTLNVRSDATAPATALAAQGGRQHPSPDAATFYASSDTRLALPATDPEVNGVAAGVALTQYQDNGGAFQSFAAPFSLAEGRHALAYRSQDRVDNLETLRGNTVLVDATPPVTTVQIGSPLHAAGNINYVTPTTPVSLSAADPALPTGEPGSGLARIEVSVDGGPFALYTAALTFAEGRHTLLYRALDNVSNAEATRSLQIYSDDTAPQTALAVLGRQAAANAGAFYAAAAARFELSATDPEVKGVASGVAFTRYQDNGGAFQSYGAPFALAEGSHVIGYQSQDNVGHLEALRTATALIDATAPRTTVSSGAPFFTAADGTRYVSPRTPVTFSAEDPQVNGVASGVERIEVSVDGGSFTTYGGALTFPEGRHAVAFRALDRVGNTEAARTLALQSDDSAPLTALAPSGNFYLAESRQFAPASFSYILSAQDPVVNQVASGVAFTRFRTAAGPFQVYGAAFSLSEGVRTVEFQSQDNVENLELLRAATIYVDATAPTSSLAVGEPRHDAGAAQPLFVSTATPLSLSAADPTVEGVASGVRQISYRANGGDFGGYAAPFNLQSPDGLKTVEHFAADNVGNQETVKSAVIALDGTAPVTALSVIGGRQFPAGAGTFYASPDTRFELPAADPAVNGVASGLALTQYSDNGGALQTFSSAFGLAAGRHALSYHSEDRVRNVEIERSTTVLIDAAAPVTTARIGTPLFIAQDGTNYVTPQTPITFTAADAELAPGTPGSGINRIEVSIDGRPVVAHGGPIMLAEGAHSIVYNAVDNVGNAEAPRTLSVQSDATPPSSTLTIGTPSVQLPEGTLVGPGTAFTITAADPVVRMVASGVRSSQYRVDGGTYTVFTAPFTLSGPDGQRTIQFFSQDNVGNVEGAKSNAVILDATAPEVALISPSSCSSGICRVFKGRLPVLGTARDAHLRDYRLEVAPGQDATTGFVLIGSGTVSVSSAGLAAWETGSLSGFHTLRLSAADQVDNVSRVQINLFIGDPGRLMVLGNHDVFHLPEGVAVGGDGRIYVADRNNDRIAVFSSTGGIVASLGARKEDDDDDDRKSRAPKTSTSTLRLNKPSAVAVDAANNIFVADTNNNRVVKLSETGQVLLQLGRRKIEREKDDDGDGRGKDQFHPGKGPGEFNKPSGVAVDGAGNIYISDTENRRVQIFTAGGAFARLFSLPEVPRSGEGDDDGDDDEQRPSLGKPVGLALDRAGNLYVADQKGRRALKFDPAGGLLMTIGGPGKEPGRFKSPHGIAVAPEGDCVLVSDRELNRIQKFDFQGGLNLVFGGKGKSSDDERRSSGGLSLRRPSGLAMDAAGNLYVADRNNDRIKKFGPPTGAATVIVPAPRAEDEHVAQEVVEREDGGEVQRKDKAAVIIPPAALREDLRISVAAAPANDEEDESDRQQQIADRKLRVVSPPVEYGPHGTQFEEPVTLIIPYNEALASAQNVAAESLSVHYWNREKRQWEQLKSEVDKLSRTVKAKTTHFSLYQVMSSTDSGIGAAAASPAAADPAFGLREVYAFPNPARAGAKPVIHVAVGVADRVKIRIFDVAGRNVLETTLQQAPAVITDASGERFAYEYTWEGHIPSGVYLYIVEAEKAGASTIRSTGKLGVVR